MILLDVFIGLVLIYFLYSLLASIIAEMISTWIGMRARMLRQGIENILNDIKTKSDSLDRLKWSAGKIKFIIGFIYGIATDFMRWFKDIFLVESKTFKYSNAGKFYAEPTIKYLGKPGDHTWYSLRNRKPSYISKENFVITVLNMFSDKGIGVSEWDKIKFAIETNALHLESDTHKMFQNLLNRSNDAFEDFVKLLQNHFDETMDRVNGWYKRKIGLFIFIIGGFMCVAFNVDTIAITKLLFQNKIVRTELADHAANVVNNAQFDSIFTSQKDTFDRYAQLQKQKKLTTNAMAEANELLGLGWTFPVDTFTKRYNPCTKASCYCQLTKDAIGQAVRLNDTLKLVKQKIKVYKNKMFEVMADSEKAVVLLGLNKEQYLRDSLIYNVGEVLKIDLVDISDIVVDNNHLTITGKRRANLWGKAMYILGQLHPFSTKLWGLLITALALSLGAQFWFDLLKKLVALRGSGTKPEAESQRQALVKEIKLKGSKITSSDPVELAISAYRNYWKTLPGFIAANKSPKANTLDLCTTGDFDPSVLSDSITKIKNDFNVVVNVIHGRFGMKSGDNGYIYYKDNQKRGKIAGVVYNQKTQQNCYLTCAHVLFNNGVTFFDEMDNAVHDKDDKVIGTISNGVNSSFIDAALIDVAKDSADFIKKYKIDTIQKIATIRDIISTNSPVVSICTYDENSDTVKYFSGKVAMYFFDYGFVGNYSMYRMMLVEHDAGPTPLPGDSGSIVKLHVSSINNEIQYLDAAIYIGSAVIDGKHYSLCLYLEDVLKTLFAKPLNQII